MCHARDSSRGPGGQPEDGGTRMDARGLRHAEMMDGARRSSMNELAAATLAADKVLVF